MDLIAAPDFQAAVRHAKAIATSMGKKELNPALLRAGFLALLESDCLVGEAKLSDREYHLRDSCIGFSLPASALQEFTGLEKLPLSERLRQIIDCKYDSVIEFVDALIKDGSSMEEADEKVFHKVIARASARMRRESPERKLDGEVLGAAAYYCYLAGDCIGYPGISVHASLCSENIEALAKRNNWTASQFMPDNGPALEIEKSVSEKLSGASAGRVITALDLASVAGARIVEQWATAVHEAGHTVASFILRPQMPVAQVSIISVAESAGRTAIDIDSAYFWRPATRKFFQEELKVLLAGGIAEQIAFGDDFLDAGAQSDIERATRSAWEWVAELGMDENFGPISLPALNDAPGYTAGYLQSEAQCAVQRLLRQAREETRLLLRENWKYVESLSKQLIERKILGPIEIAEIFLERGIVGWPGTRRVRSRAVEREVHIALEDGVCKTIEGPVRYRAGDALVFGEEGERWPVAFERFGKSYEPVGDLAFGHDGTYKKIERDALAFQLRSNLTVALSDGRGALSGKTGDWIVDYGSGDLSLVSERLFESYYKVVDDEGNPPRA